MFLNKRGNVSFLAKNENQYSYLLLIMEIESENFL